MPETTDPTRKPDHWYDDPTWRCANGHVSKTKLKSEERGPLCLVCREPVELVDPRTKEEPTPAEAIAWAEREIAGYLVFVGDEDDPFPGEPYNHELHPTPEEAVVDVAPMYPRLWLLPMYEGQPYEVDFTGEPITPGAEAGDV